MKSALLKLCVVTLVSLFSQMGLANKLVINLAESGTLSNYTKKAQKFLESNPMIRGINGTELVDLILQYYESLSKEYREMIPLKKVYIPISKESD